MAGARSCTSGMPSSATSAARRVCPRWPFRWRAGTRSMGSVRRIEPRGTLFLDFRYQGRRCREYTALADTDANRKRLARVLTRLEQAIAAGTFEYAEFFQKELNRRAAAAAPKATDSTPTAIRSQPPAPSEASTPTFRDFVEQWIREHAVEWRRSHLRTLRSTIERHLLPRFGDVRVCAIRRADILAFRAQLATLPGRGKRPALSNKRINGIIGPLKQILNEAAERYEFPPPTANLKPLKLRRTDVFPFTLEEVNRILAAVRPDYRDYLLVRFFTGMRSGEVDGLKWKYVDFDRRLILVRETLVLGQDDYTKTEGSQRDIQMSTPVYEALRRQEQRSRQLSPYVFCNRAGHPIDNKNFTERIWRPLLRHLGLPPRRPYQMRHTAATLWLAAGESPEWIARQLGHTSTQMLFRVYSRYVPNLTRQDGSAMERLLRSTLAAPASLDAEPADATHRPSHDPRR
ncbi:MAG: tyrosine-type recombinase/integrase [Pseudomonadota bacterium]